MRGHRRKLWGAFKQPPSKLCECGATLYQDNFTGEFYEVSGSGWDQLRKKHVCADKYETDEKDRQGI